jgi:hypothetical protein
MNFRSQSLILVYRSTNSGFFCFAFIWCLKGSGETCRPDAETGLPGVENVSFHARERSRVRGYLKIYHDTFPPFCFLVSKPIRFSLWRKNTRDKTCLIFLYTLDVRESVHRDIIMKATNKMQLCKLIYYS